MGKMIPVEVRRRIIQARRDGQAYAQIAEAFHCSERAAKQLYARFQREGDAVFETRYHNCGRQSPYDEAIRKRLRAVKTGRQGAPYVWSKVRHEAPTLQLPHIRTLQRWWRAAGEQQPRGRRHHAERWTREVHHTWQIDGKEQIPLASGQEVSWMNIADEGSGAQVHAEVFPLCHDAHAAARFGHAKCE